MTLLSLKAVSLYFITWSLTAVRADVISTTTTTILYLKKVTHLAYNNYICILPCGTLRSHVKDIDIDKQWYMYIYIQLYTAMYICLIYTCLYTKVFEVIQGDMRHLRLSFDIVWQWKNIGLSGRLKIYKVISSWQVGNRCRLTSNVYLFFNLYTLTWSFWMSKGYLSSLYLRVNHSIAVHLSTENYVVIYQYSVWYY